MSSISILSPNALKAPILGVSGMVSYHCFLLFSVVLRSIQLSLSRFAVLGNHQCLVCVLALLPSLTLTSCRVLGNRQVFYLSTVSCNLLVEFWAIEHLQLSFSSLDLVRSSYSPGSGSGRPPHLHQVNRCLLPRNIEGLKEPTKQYDVLAQGYVRTLKKLQAAR